MKQKNNVEPVFFAQAGANYIKSNNKFSLHSEKWGLLIPGHQYLKLGTKDRTSFTWTQPIEYNGTMKINSDKYVIFGMCEHKKEFIAYAFPCVDEKTLLQLNTGMKGARDIKIDKVEEYKPQRTAPLASPGSLRGKGVAPSRTGTSGYSKNVRTFTDNMDLHKRTIRTEIRCSPVFKEVLEDIQDALKKEYGQKYSESDILHHAVAHLAAQYGIIETKQKEEMEMEFPNPTF